MRELVPYALVLTPCREDKGIQHQLEKRKALHGLL
jgi:hypothetical protein